MCISLTVMSSFAFMGFFCLAQGKRVMTMRSNNSRIWHAHYTTSIQCADGTAYPTDIRIYSPMNDVLHTDNTIAFVYARAHMPLNAPAILDASHIVPCPGDVQNDSYEDFIPDMPNPFIIVLGQVNGKGSHLPDGSRTFPMTVSKYIRNAVQPSSVVCIFHCS